MEHKLVYSIPEVAERLSIGRGLVYRLLNSGELRSLKIGHRRLVARDDLEAYVARLRDGEAA